VARPGSRHFVGFSLQRSRDGNVMVRLSTRSRERIRRRIVELTRRNWGQSLRACAERLNQYLEGWIQFFKICDHDEARVGLKMLDSHVRRRIRALVLRQKKRKLHMLRWLIRQRKVKVRVAVRDLYSGHRSLWALSITEAAHKGMSQRFFAALGLVELRKRWRQLQPIPDIAPEQLELALG